MKNWNDNEVKALFQTIEACKMKKEPLVFAFGEHAKNFNRKPNSVRNYYYHEVDNLGRDKNRCLKLGIDLKNHDKSHFVCFDKVQENDLFAEIDKMTAKGISVRSACLKLSGGDLGLMTRFQNKYQNMKRKLVKKEQKSNIIPFKKQKMLTDSDINSLFLGLVKLIKKSAQDEVLENNPVEILKSEMAAKEEQLEKLKTQLTALKKENLMLREMFEQEGLSKTKVLEKHLQQRRKEENSQVRKRG